ncbi:uncharacterized protein B0I36DRAFT_360174 [Microdochium trichocladiopsis]|uniref:VOC domain-containing protein n=1 Tax=Microdochium trichocladiopsis TaxID=1682393 RepID=A0A9P9BQA6_9PEZI|nr:uncharacterized protein B0I36DRAFT_360174 [Microdochium trichocladiopsis]KAH7034678.1 hypothetical protein B0I36DRAFT_360174 [Microdochium trichocladiopsis]
MAANANSQGTFNRPINHVAISCTDIDALVQWYAEVLGFQVISDVRHCKRSVDPTPFDTIFVSYPAETLQELKFAIMTSGNGVGIELFQFIDPAPEPGTGGGFNFTRTGFFHICVTDNNPEVLLSQIESRGGKRVGDYMDYSRYGLEGHKGIYTQDPWGNVIEVMSISLERVSSTGEALAKAAETLQKLARESEQKL